MELLSPKESVSFWPEHSVLAFPFQIAIMRNERSDQRGSFPGDKPDWMKLLRELWVARSGYALLSRVSDERQYLDLACGRLIVRADVDRRRGAPRLWLSGGGMGVRFGGNHELRRFLAHGVPIRHGGIWIGGNHDFRKRYEHDRLYASGRYIEQIIEQVAECVAGDDEEPRAAIAPARGEQIVLLDALQRIADAEFELEQRAAQIEPGFHYFAARAEARRSTVKRYFRLSLVEDDCARLRDASTAIKTLSLEETPGHRLLVELENAHLDDSDILISTVRQTTRDDVPANGVLQLSASPKQYEARRKALAALRDGVARNTWLASCASETQQLKPFPLVPFVPSDGFAPNPSQADAIAKGLATPDYMLVLGPPGTGKTTVIYSWVERFVAEGKRVLITSHGNRAVDNVLARVARDKTFTCVRLGNESKLSSNMRELLLDNCAVELQRTIASSIDERFAGVGRVRDHYQRVLRALASSLPLAEVASELRACEAALAQELTPLRRALDLGQGESWKAAVATFESLSAATALQLQRNAAALARGGWLWLFHRVRAFMHRRRAAKLQRRLDALRNELHATARTQQDRLEGVAAVVGEWHALLTSQRQQGLYSLLLRLVDVVGATCIGIDTNRYFGDAEFDVVIVDEAGQIQLHNLAVPMAKGAKVILVGDHKQLPPVPDPTLVAELATRDELEERKTDGELLECSWFERKWKMAPEDRKAMLDTQFRCPSTISEFIAEAFYDGRYFAGGDTASRTPLLPDFTSTLVFIDTSGLPPKQRFEQRLEGAFAGNRLETRLVVEVVEYFAARLPALLEDNELGVIAPLKLHVEEIKREFARLKARGGLAGLAAPPAELVATVDSYQGQERDLIVYAAGRSNAGNKVGFLADWRRLNVAMTRAKRQLVMIGDLATLTGRSEQEARDGEFKRAMRVLVEHVRRRGQLIPAAAWLRATEGR